MDLNKLSIFKMMGDKMAWDSQRQAVLSQNIANADTPGYQAQDLAPYDFKAALRDAPQLQMLTSDPGHLGNGESGRSPFHSGVERTPYETKPDGNAVSLEDQLNRMGQNNIDFQAVTNLLRSQIGMLKTALGRGGSS